MLSPWRSVKGHVYNYLKSDGHTLLPSSKLDSSKSSSFCTSTSDGKMFFCKVFKTTKEDEYLEMEYMAHRVLEKLYNLNVKIIHVKDAATRALQMDWIGENDLCDIALSQMYRSNLLLGGSYIFDLSFKVARDVGTSLMLLHEKEIGR